MGSPSPVPDHVALIAGESEKFKAATQLVVMPDDCFGLKGMADIGQMQFDGNPLSGLKFGRQDRGHTAFADIK